MDALLSIFNSLPENLIYFLLFGTNKKVRWALEAKENQIIIINKFRHQVNRQIEFVRRVLIIDFILYFLNDIWLIRVINKGFQLFLKSPKIQVSKDMVLSIVATLLIIEFIATTIFFITHFNNGLIGIDTNIPKKKRLTYPIMTVNFLEFIFIFIRIYYINSILLYFIFIAAVLVFCVIKSLRLKKHEIYRFLSGSSYESSDAPRLDKDFYINLKYGKNKHRRINLLETNLYICDNDDILLMKKSKNSEIIKKENIENLQIKNTYIVYKDEWKKEN